MSNYKVIRPRNRVNYVKNPQFRHNVTDGWTFSQPSGSSGGASRTTSFQWVGPYGCNLSPGTGTAWLTSSYVVGVPNQWTVFLSAFAYGFGGDAAIEIYQTSGTPASRATDSESSLSGWKQLSASWYNNTGSAVNVEIRLKSTAASSAIVFDAIMWEMDNATPGTTNDRLSTYADGDQEGCWWYGEPHNSYSERSAASRAGGIILDLCDDLDFGVKTLIDGGGPSYVHHLHRYAIRPGGEVRGTQIHPAAFTMHGLLRDQDYGGDNLHALRKQLKEELMPWAYPKSRGQYQPVMLRYLGAETDKYIAAHVEDPTLRGSLSTDAMITNREELDINWMAPYPFWRALQTSARQEYARDTTTTYGILTYDGTTGNWAPHYGLGVHTSFGSVEEILYNRHDGCIYVFGQFDGWLGNSGWNNVVRFNLDTSNWEQVGGGDAVNDTVRAAAIAANGDIYIGGNFVNCGGAGGDYIAYFDLSAGSWSPVSGGGTGTVYAVDFDARGNFWFGGDFTDWNSNVSIDHIGYWDGAAYQAAGSGADGIIYDLLMLGESVYAVGAFTTPGDSAASWNGTSWTDLNPNGTVGQARMMAVSADGSIYMWDYANETIVRFTGASFVQIGTISRSGRTANIQAMAETPNGELWVSGLFDSVDGIDNTEYMARWTGSAWAPFPVTAQEPFLAMEFYNQDPMVENNFHAWIGAGGSGTSYEIPITETFTNNGDAPAHLRLIFEQSSVKGTIRTIKSVTNGKQLFPNYTMLPGETVVIDIRETYVSVESDMRGSIPHALLVGGDEATFLLDPGDNVLELLVESSSANSSRVIGVWHDTFTGVD